MVTSCRWTTHVRTEETSSEERELYRSDLQHCLCANYSHSFYHRSHYLSVWTLDICKRQEGECSEWTWMQPNNIGVCSERTWMQPKFLQRGLRRWGNGEGSWQLFRKGHIASMEMVKAAGTTVIATFRNDRICFHGGGRDVYDGLSLNQHCCSKTSTGEATYSKIKGLDDCFTEMRKSYTSLFVHENLRAHSSEGITPFAQLRKFSTIIYDHLWYTRV